MTLQPLLFWILLHMRKIMFFFFISVILNKMLCSLLSAVIKTKYGNERK
jgi:hypothetical protein